MITFGTALSSWSKAAAASFSAASAFFTWSARSFVRASSSVRSSGLALGMSLPSSFCSARSSSYAAMDERRVASAARASSTIVSDSPRARCDALTRSGSVRSSFTSITPGSLPSAPCDQHRDCRCADRAAPVEGSAHDRVRTSRSALRGLSSGEVPRVRARSRGAPLVTARRSRTSILIVVSLFVAFLGWSVLLFSWPALLALDNRLVAPPLDPMSNQAQIAAAFALLTWPGIEYAVLVGLAIWAYQRRLRSLTLALLLTVALGWAATDLIKWTVARPRPPDHLDVMTAWGYAYPSGHVVGVVAFCIAIGAVFRVSRSSPRARLRWTVGSTVLILAVAFDRWFLGAHHIGDIIGGALLGGFVATFALVVCGVSVPIPHTAVVEIVRDRREAANPPSVTDQKRCAVIYNPVKVTDWTVFRRHVEYE